MSKPSTYELSEQVLNEEGSLRQIGTALDISRGYVSMLRKARENCAVQVIDHWRSGELPWELVRALSHVSRSEQLSVLRPYLRVIRTEPEHAKDALKEAVRTVKALRGIGMPVAKAEEIYEEAKALYQDDDCQIESKKIVPAEGGFWVPAMVWVPEENIGTEG
jgi:hypothetical protein